MGRFFGVIASIMPKSPDIEYLKNLFLEAEKATTWEIRLDAFGLGITDGLNCLWTFRRLLSKKTVILTRRPSYENGKWPHFFDQWKFWRSLPPWLSALIASRKTRIFVDWELELVQWIQKNGVDPLFPWSKIGASHHDFEGGRSLEYLAHHSSVLRSAKARAFLKFVVMAKCENDVKSLRNVSKLHEDDSRPFIFFGMGKEGQESRRKCISWGSAGTYGYLPEREIAGPGQLSIFELLEDPDIQKILGNVRKWG
jgi:3-dehydroquinate dehydratase type I